MSQQTNSLFIDIYKHSQKDGCIFNFMYGARGKGKTYSALRVPIETDTKYLYIRTKDVEYKECCKDKGNPYKRLNLDMGWSVQMKHGLIYTKVEKELTLHGYCGALTTMGNMRGSDFSDVSIIIWDEFMQKNSEKKIKGTSTMIFDLYETVARNREILGEDPVKLYALSNANTIYNDVFAELGIIPKLETMVKNGEHKYIDRERSLAVYSFPPSEFESLKSETALYKLIRGSDYAKMALGNEFAYDSWFNVCTKPLIEYRAICAIDDIYIYRHKASRNYYACRTRASCPEFKSPDTYIAFLRNFAIDIREHAAAGRMYYCDMEVKCKILDLLKI